MLQALVYRLLLSVPLLFVVTALSFFLVSLTPGDPAVTILGQNQPPEAYAALREQLGLNKPIMERYEDWLGKLLHGNLGDSVFNEEPVTDTLNSRIGVTLSLVAGTTLVAAAIGIVLGITSAVRRGILGRVVDTLSLLGFAVPNFWLALILVALFAVRLSWFPVLGYVDPSTSLVGWLHSLILPVVVLSASAVGAIAQQTRSSMLDVLQSPFIRTLRAGGIPPRSLFYRHAFRNAAIPIVTIIGLNFVGLLSGTIIVETIFALPGLGSLATQATVNHDLPVIQGVVLYFTVIVILTNLLVDLAYAWLNPKVRIS